jgi:hypothetical protein
MIKANHFYIRNNRKLLVMEVFTDTFRWTYLDSSTIFLTRLIYSYEFTPFVHNYNNIWNKLNA